jgi:hypothetical protein
MHGLVVGSREGGLTASFGSSLVLLVLGLKSHTPIGTRWAESANVIWDMLGKVILGFPEVRIKGQEEFLCSLYV